MIILAVVLTNVFSVVATPINNFKINEEAVAHLIDSNKNFKIFNDSVIMHDNMNFAPVYKYLKLDDSQYKEFYNIHKDLYNSIKTFDNTEIGANTFNNHLKVDLKNSYYILNKKQYNKYLRVLNVTLINKNISNYVQ